MTVPWSSVVRAGGLLGLGLASLILIGAAVLDVTLGRDVLFITPKAPEAILADRDFWEPGDPVAEIYGTPAEQPARVLFIDDGKLIRPEEDRSLVLLPVDKTRGENPFQVKMLWFFAGRLAGGLGLAGLVGIALGAFLSRRRR